MRAPSTAGLEASTRRSLATNPRDGAEPVRGTADHWAELIAGLASEQPIHVFVSCREEPTVEQV